MRIAVLVLGLLLGAGLVAQSGVDVGAGELFRQAQAGPSGRVGLAMAGFWMLGCVAVLWQPWIAAVLFAAAAVAPHAAPAGLGIATASPYVDPRAWSAVSAALALLSVSAALAGRKQAARDEAERSREVSRQRALVGFELERLAGQERRARAGGSATQVWLGDGWHAEGWRPGIRPKPAATDGARQAPEDVPPRR